MHWASRKTDGLMLADKADDSEKINTLHNLEHTWTSEQADDIISDFRNYRI